MRRGLLLVVSCWLLVSAAGAQEDWKPKPAKDVLKAAQSQAGREKKAVMVVFHASWCGWCKKLDKVMAMPDVRRAMEKWFVTVHLDVLEQPSNKALENPGGVEVMEKNGGKGAGLPFFYFSDAKGKMIVNSIRPGHATNTSDAGGNVGCPYEPAEIGWFMEMVAKGAPKMSDEDRTTIRVALEGLKKAGG